MDLMHMVGLHTATFGDSFSALEMNSRLLQKKTSAVSPRRKKRANIAKAYVQVVQVVQIDDKEDNNKGSKRIELNLKEKVSYVSCLLCISSMENEEHVPSKHRPSMRLNSKSSSRVSNN
jgi:hypothetical protein